MTPIAHGRAPRETWAQLPRLAQGTIRLAVFVTAWLTLLAVVARG